MNLKQKIIDLRKKANDLFNKAKAENRLFTKEEQETFDNDLAEIAKCQQMIDAEEKLGALNADRDKPANPPNHGEFKDSNPKLFKNFGEQLQAIQKAGMDPSNIDPRLAQLNAASGSSTGTAEDGGFIVQTDFSTGMLDTAFKESGIISACDTYDISKNSKGVNFVDVDETSIATTVCGGVIAYWASEAGTVTKSKPTFTNTKLELEKLMGIGYATDELMEDAPFMSELYGRAFTSAMMREIESAILSGDGKGKPLGIINAPGTVSVDAESGQTADTFNHTNAEKMYLRLHWAKRAGARWLIHPDIESQLSLMTFAGSTTYPIPIYMPPNGLSQSPFSTLKGIPVIPTDNCSAVGDKGDVILCNLKDYMIIRKGDIKQDASIHVRFLYGENTFRFTYRLNGAPKKKSALTIKNSANTRGSFVTLAAR